MSRSIRFVSKSKRRLTFFGALLVALAASIGAFAYFTSIGTGTGTANAGTLTAPGKPLVPITSGTVNLSWAAGTVDGGTVLYHVERRNDPGAIWTSVCASTDATPIPGLSCSDTPGTGTFVYRVTSRYASWRTTGPESDPVLGDAPPYVISIDRDDANPTNATTLDWTVTFSESVTGVDATDFALAASGVTGATISGFTGSGSTYTVTAGGVTGDGTLGLNLDDDDSIQDVASNPLADSVGGTNGDFTGQLYIVDNTSPSVTIDQAGGQGDPSNDSSIDFTVVFSEAVTGFADVDVTLSGTAGATTANVTGGPTTYNVAVSGMASDGSVIASIGANAAQDASGNDSSASTSDDDTVTYDGTAPSVTINQAAGQADPTNASPIDFTVVFSEAVTGFTGSDPTLSGATTATVTGGPMTYNVAVTGMAPQATVTAAIAADAAQDAAGNGNTSSSSTDNSVTYESVAPSVTLTAPANNAFTNNTTPTFSGACTNGDGNVTVTVKQGATTIQTGTASCVSASYSVSASPALAEGTYTAQASQTDAATNVGLSSTNTFSVDTTAPVVTLVAPADGSVTNDTTPTLSGTCTTGDDNVTVTVKQGPTTIQTLTPACSSGSFTVNAAVLGENTYTAVASQTDAAGNAATSSTNTVTVDTTAPTVMNVTSPLANGSYKAGQLVPVTVTFSEPVTVTGTPQLLLETGATDRQATYTSGSGTATLTFNYTVQAGDTSADLNYVATNSLTLNAGTVQDAVTNNATLTLPGLAAAGSLATNKAIVIDTTAPTVMNVTSPLANGSYKAGQLVPVTVTFSEPVTVTGTPQLLLETGATDRQATYTSGSGTATLTFNYTVQAGDTSADLNYVATNSLTLNAGTVQDAVTNNATLTLPGLAAAGSLATNKAIVIDTTAPTATSVVANDGGSQNDPGEIDNDNREDTLVFTYSENINPGSLTTGNISVTFTNNDATCAGSADSITVPGVGKTCLGSQAWLTSTSTSTQSLSVSGSVVTLAILVTPAGAGTGVTASNFTWSTSGGTAADSAGNVAAGSTTPTSRRF